MTGPGGQSPIQTPFRIEDIRSVWDYEVKLTWLVEDLIPEGSITLLSGDSGAGKSTLALALSGSAVRGTPFLGLVTHQCPVLYIDRENPLAVVKERLCRLGIEETDRLTYWGGWCVEQLPAGPGDPAILRFARERKPLIIFDSLVAFHSGSEQDASETRRHMHLYRRLADFGATVALLHHTGKSETAREYRGSSDIKAAVDCAYLLESHGKGGDAISTLTLRCYKSRLMPGKALHISYDQAGGFVRSEAPRKEMTHGMVENILNDGVGRTQSDLVAALKAGGMAYHPALKAVRDAEASGAVTVNGPGNRRIYALANSETAL